MFAFLESPFFDRYTDWIASVVIHGAPFTPIILILLEEAGIPLPIPGDIYIAFIGYQISLGHISFITAFILLIVAVLTGSSILYFISAHWGKILVSKLGVYLHLNEKRLLQVESNFKKYGVLVIIFGRHIPGMRVPITVFSGISGVSYKTFITSTFISVVFWVLFYLYIGDKLGKSIMNKLHANPGYLLIFTIPIMIFFLSFIYIKVKHK